MDNKKVAIVLGGTNPHGAALQKLKERGYYTILVDYLDAPPAAQFADLHLHDSAMDLDIVVEIAKKYKAEIVLAPCLDQQMLIAVQAAEILGLPHPFSSEIALNVTNKKYMKKIMIENGLPTAKYVQVNENTNIADVKTMDFRYPLIVKPVDNSGSAGTRKIYSPEEIPDAIDNAYKWSRTKEAIVEEFITGIEVSAYGFIKNGQSKLILTQRRYSSTENDLVKCYGTLSPAAISDEVAARIEQIGADIASAFHFDNTPLFYQMMIDGDDIYILEFSPRLGGGVSYKYIERNARYDIINASIDSWLGVENNREPDFQHEFYLLYQIQGDREAVFGSIEGYQEMINQGYIEEIFFHKTRGAHVSRDKASAHRLAAVMIKGNDVGECTEKLGYVMKHVRALDIDGNDITDRTPVLYEDIEVSF